MHVSEQIRSFVQKRFHKEVSATDSLLDSGLVDSVGVFEMVAFVEERFGVKISDDDIVPEHFETIETLEALIGRLRQARSAS